MYLFTLPLPSLYLSHFPYHSVSFRIEVTPSVRIAKRRHCVVAGLHCRYPCMCVYCIQHSYTIIICMYTMYLQTRLRACKRCLTDGANTKKYETRISIIVIGVLKSLRIIFRLILGYRTVNLCLKKKYTRVYNNNINMCSVCNVDIIQIWVITHNLNKYYPFFVTIFKPSKNNHCSLRK